MSEHSVHFGAVLDFFVGEDEGRTSRVVEVLKELNPLDSLDNEGAARSRLQSFLLGGASPPLEPAGPETFCAAAIAKVLIYEGGRGRRDAVSELLDLAEAMPEPGRIVFTECEQYRWLLEDPQYDGMSTISPSRGTTIAIHILRAGQLNRFEDVPDAAHGVDHGLTAQ